MSGIGMALAATGGAPAPAPLSVDVRWIGQTPLNVTAASGVAEPAAAPYAANVLSYFIAGGVPPYVESGGLMNNPSGKLAIAPASDGIHNSIAWSGFTINEVESTDVTYNVTDSTGTTASATYTGIIVRRTS